MRNTLTTNILLILILAVLSLQWWGHERPPQPPEPGPGVVAPPMAMEKRKFLTDEEKKKVMIDKFSMEDGTLEVGGYNGNDFNLSEMIVRVKIPSKNIDREYKYLSFGMIQSKSEFRFSIPVVQSKTSPSERISDLSVEVVNATEQ
ncbi:MAG: hypothetical protein V4507_11530 [Verrucomicrobiota bacterium]